jgi:hypothetical protein
VPTPTLATVATPPTFTVGVASICCVTLNAVDIAPELAAVAGDSWQASPATWMSWPD